MHRFLAVFKIDLRPLRKLTLSALILTGICIITGCVACAPKAPNDAAMIDHFNEHEAEFNELKDMFLGSEDLEHYGLSQNVLTLEMIEMLPQEQANYYRELFTALGIIRITSYEAHSLPIEERVIRENYTVEMLYFQGWVPVMGHDSEQKWYGFTREPEFPIVTSTDIRPPQSSMSPIMRRISNDWFIMHHYPPE